MSRRGGGVGGRRGGRTSDGRPEEGACAVLFSGGSDSTLAAALMAQRFGRVHLLTFDRRTVRSGGLVLPGLRGLERSRENLERLRSVFGAERFDQTVADTTALFRRIAVEPLAEDRRRFGSRLLLLVCMGCKLAMHATALAICRELSVRRVADGASRWEAYYPDQTPAVMSRLAKMYAEHGIEYSNPVYAHEDKGSVHDALRSLGIDMGAPPTGLLSPKRYKEAFLSFDTQAWCFFGLEAAVYNRLYYGPLHGAERESDALAYIESKIGVVRAFLEERARGA